uniref:Putative secreted protein n=1 Tax=Anopheles darlingi TaxID=43151 RepID=A0A2M4DD32_ANODA
MMCSWLLLLLLQYIKSHVANVFSYTFRSHLARGGERTLGTDLCRRRRKPLHAVLDASSVTGFGPCCAGASAFRLRIW